MSGENVTVVRRLYQAMADRDLEAVRALTDADLEWISDPRLGVAPLRGRENVIRFFLDQDEIFDDLRPEPERYLDNGDLVLVFVRVSGRGRGSGAEVEIRIGHLWTLRNGLLVRGEGYGNRDEALEAAGLSAQEPDAGGRQGLVTESPAVVREGRSRVGPAQRGRPRRAFGRG